MNEWLKFQVFYYLRNNKKNKNGNHEIENKKSAEYHQNHSCFFEKTNKIR